MALPLATGPWVGYPAVGFRLMGVRPPPQGLLQTGSVYDLLRFMDYLIREQPWRIA